MGQYYTKVEGSIRQNFAKKDRKYFLLSQTLQLNVQQTYIWVFNLYNMIYHSCCMLIFFFFFAQLVVTLPNFFFFKKCCQYNTYCFQYIKLIFDFCWKKRSFLCVSSMLSRFPKIMLWILKMLKTKTKSSKINVRFGILRAIF